MKRKLFSCVLTVLVLIISISTSVSAYQLASYRPSIRTLYWGYHSTAPSVARSPISAAATTWNKTLETFSAYNNSKVYSSTINASDSNNSVGGRVSSLPGAPSGWIAATLTPYSNYSTFDIITNANMTFSNNGASGSYDYQGVFTHEFGHVFGLADLYGGCSELVGKVKYNVPTMYGYSYFDGEANIYLYLSTTEADDVNGKAYVSSLIR